MGGQVRVIYTNDLNNFDPAAVAGLHVGDIVADPSGSGPPPRMVVRNAPGGPLMLFNPAGGVQLNTAVFVPGAGGSGDGTVNVSVVDAAGDPIENALVDVDVISSGAVAGLDLAGGTGALSSTLAVGNSARARGQTNAAGMLSLALSGATTATYRITVAPVRSNAVTPEGDAMVVLTGNLP